MAVVWNIGAVFGLAWLIFFGPVMIIGMFWFYNRREFQPIKARNPTMVLITDVILLFWILFNCFQRIIVDEYPCLVSLWTGWVGLIVLFNAYMWRCWQLYFTFQLTQERLDGVPKSQSKFVKRRHWIHGAVGFKFFGTMTVILVLPCGILTSTNEDLPRLYGDQCTRSWGEYLLGFYVLAYSVVFSWFAHALRQVVEGFRIKEEMKFTGILALVVFIPWVMFNAIFDTINDSVFPFSTLAMWIGVSLAFIVSTLVPLFRSLSPPDIGLENLPSDLGTLEGLLTDKKGVASFKKFLTKEFSVENILFYEEIEEFRKKQATRMDQLELVGEAQRIYAKYIIIDSPFQVNLPDPIVRELESKLKDMFSGTKMAEFSPESGGGGDRGGHEPSHVRTSSEQLLLHQKDTPTIFDKAQENIFKLMSTDSFPRYQRSDEYKKLVQEIEAIRKRKDILYEEGVIGSEQPRHLHSVESKASITDS